MLLRRSSGADMRRGADGTGKQLIAQNLSIMHKLGDADGRAVVEVLDATLD
jgi:hypothetical protein